MTHVVSRCFAGPLMLAPADRIFSKRQRVVSLPAYRETSNTSIRKASVIRYRPRRAFVASRPRCEPIKAARQRTNSLLLSSSFTFGLSALGHKVNASELVNIRWLNVCEELIRFLVREAARFGHAISHLLEGQPVHSRLRFRRRRKLRAQSAFCSRLTCLGNAPRSQQLVNA